MISIHNVSMFALCAAIVLAVSVSVEAKEDTGSRNRPLTRREKNIETAGDFIQLAIPISALIYSSSIRDWEGNLQLGESYVSTAAGTQLLKYTIREERPYQDEDTHGHSFPSGHTSAAFSGAAYWQTRYGWEVGVPMYAAAAFVGYSRVKARKHNWADVIAGGALGIGINYCFVSEYAKDPINVSLGVEDEFAVLRVGFTF